MIRTLATLVSIGLLLPNVAFAQGVAGRFYPEKDTYLVGEPVFIIFELSNNSQQSVWVDGRLGQPCLTDDTIKVDGAKPAWYGWKTGLNCQRGIGGDCASGLMEIKPGQHQVDRILLDDLYDLSEPGTYEVQIIRHFPAYSQNDFSFPISPVEVSADFDISLVEGSDEELQSAFEPVVKDLSSTDFNRRWEAIRVVTELAQPFLEQVILGLSKNENSVSSAIEGLYKLNTAAARARLAEIAEKDVDDGVRQSAMGALADMGDKSYLPLFFRLARTLKDGSQNVAIESAGLLGGEEAVSFVASFLRSTDADVRTAAVRGLAGTKSRSAVVPLILALGDPDPSVRQIASVALAQLTHRSLSANVWEPGPNPWYAFLKWHDWWLQHGSDAPIYGPNECAQPTPLN